MHSCEVDEGLTRVRGKAEACHTLRCTLDPGCRLPIVVVCG